MTITNPDLSVKNHDQFIYNGKKLKVVGTESTGRFVSDAIDTIKNLETNKLTKISRKQLAGLKITEIKWNNNTQ